MDLLFLIKYVLVFESKAYLILINYRLLLLLLPKKDPVSPNKAGNILYEETINTFMMFPAISNLGILDVQPKLINIL